MENISIKITLDQAKRLREYEKFIMIHKFGENLELYYYNNIKITRKERIGLFGNVKHNYFLEGINFYTFFKIKNKLTCSEVNKKTLLDFFLYRDISICFENDRNDFDRIKESLSILGYNIEKQIKSE